MLRANNIHKSYGSRKNKHYVLKGIDLDIQSGEFVAIMGASGSGKTTLLNVLSSIDRLDEGSIRINDEELTEMNDQTLAEFRKNHLGFIFQEYYLLDTLTVKENILLPLSVQHMSKKVAEEAFQRIATELSILDVAYKYPNELSGGQQQRTSAARAMIHEPAIVFADEPTGALDSKAASDLLQHIRVLHEQNNSTIVMVTHDPVVASYSSRVVFIKDGRIYAQMYKGTEAREQYLTDILKTQAVLSGVHYET